MMNYYENIPDDQFVEIPDCGGYYECNKRGEFRSLDRIVPHKRDGQKFIKGALLKPSLNDSGYYKIGICINNVLRNKAIHILLAKTFIPNPHNYPIVRHLNDKKLDNRLENLAWGTYRDNSLDAVRNGTLYTPKGEKHHWYGRRVEPPNKGVKGVSANNNKIILDTQSGVFFYGTADAAYAKGINASTLRCKLNGHYKNNTGLIYV